MSDNKTPLSILAGSIIIGIFIYLGFNFKLQLPEVSNLTPTPELSPTKPELSPTVTTNSNQMPTKNQNPSPTITPKPTPSDHELIKAILIQETNISAGNIEFSISENNGQIARGGVRDKNSVGGAMWFAAKINGQWNVTYTGHGVPECSEVNPYNYPTSWADYCVDEHGNTVAR